MNTENAINTIELMKQRLQVLKPTYLEIIDESAAHQNHYSGNAGHYQLIISSVLFANQSLVKQHQMIYSALGSLMQEGIHALAIKIK